MKRLALLFALITSCLSANCFVGPYAGVRFGVIAQNAKTRIENRFPNNSLAGVIGPIFDPTQADLGGRGIIAGAHGGWNAAYGRFRLGVEVAGDWSYLEQEERYCNFVVYDTLVSLERQAGVYGALRLGVVHGSSFLYATLGAAGTQWVFEVATDTRPLQGVNGGLYRLSARQFLAGFRPGIGVAMQLNRRTSIALESAYTLYERARLSGNIAGDPSLGVGAQVLGRIRPRTLEVLIRLDFNIG